TCGRTSPSASTGNCGSNGSGKAPARSSGRSSPARWSSAAPARWPEPLREPRAGASRAEARSGRRACVLAPEGHRRAVGAVIVAAALHRDAAAGIPDRQDSLPALAEGLGQRREIVIEVVGVAVAEDVVQLGLVHYCLDARQIAAQVIEPSVGVRLV